MFSLGGASTEIRKLLSGSCWSIIMLVNKLNIQIKYTFYLLAMCHFVSALRKEINKQILLWKYIIAEKFTLLQVLTSEIFYINPLMPGGNKKVKCS